MAGHLLPTRRQAGGCCRGAQPRAGLKQRRSGGRGTDAIKNLQVNPPVGGIEQACEHFGQAHRREHQAQQAGAAVLRRTQGAVIGVNGQYQQQRGGQARRLGCLGLAGEGGFAAVHGALDRRAQQWVGTQVMAKQVGLARHGLKKSDDVKIAVRASVGGA